MNEWNHKVSAKRPDTGKFWSYGSLRKNKFDKYQVSMKVTPELRALIEAHDGGWINFSLFEDDKPKEVSSETKQQLDNLYQAVSDDDTIPF